VPFGPYVADFACAAARLVVESDGRTHATLDKAARDEERDRWFQGQGWRVLRLDDELVIGSPELGVEQIRQALYAQPPSPDPAPRGHPLPGRERERSR